MMSENLARFVVADVFDGLAQLEDDSIDLVVTSPPFLALRSYLPADHPDKSKEIGSEATPAEFIDTLLAVTAELRRVLAPHGSICVELGDTYAGSGGGGGDYLENGWREGQQQFAGSAASMRESNAAHWRQKNQDPSSWPLAKSRALIPQLYEIALAYGANPLTGQPSPAGQWRVRNVVTWARPNPPVGALGDKWRPATSDLIVACTSGKRYWDDLATRKEPVPADRVDVGAKRRHTMEGGELGPYTSGMKAGGAPLLDYWEIPPGGYKGSHYAVFPEELVVPCVKAMCPEKVCRTCGEPSRRIVETSYEALEDPVKNNAEPTARGIRNRPGDMSSAYSQGMRLGRASRSSETLGWTDCGHDNWRSGITLDPFAGSGTTLEVAVKWGRDAVGFDLDERNAALARERVGDSLFHSLVVERSA